VSNLVAKNPESHGERRNFPARIVRARAGKRQIFIKNIRNEIRDRAALISLCLQTDDRERLREADERIPRGSAMPARWSRRKCGCRNSGGPAGPAARACARSENAATTGQSRTRR